MQAGKLRHVIACDEPVLNDAGEATGFVERFTHWASIRPLRGREQLHADQIIADADTTFNLRSTPRSVQIDATWRLRHRGVIYNIASIIPVDMADREIEILAKSGLNKG